MDTLRHCDPFAYCPACEDDDTYEEHDRALEEQSVVERVMAFEAQS